MYLCIVESLAYQAYRVHIHVLQVPANPETAHFSSLIAAGLDQVNMKTQQIQGKTIETVGKQVQAGSSMQQQGVHAYRVLHDQYAFAFTGISFIVHEKSYARVKMLDLHIK